MPAVQSQEKVEQSQELVESIVVNPIEPAGREEIVEDLKTLSQVQLAPV